VSANTRFLRERFLRRLVEEAPGSVLDVGCGDGELLAGLSGVVSLAVGVEPAPARAARARARGLCVARASAERLPFADAAFAWVALRHVLHHTADPARALAEAARVARDGLLVAEPWRDLSSPPQRTARLLDDWRRARDRAAGEPHHPDLPPHELARLLARCGTWTLALEIHQQDELRPLPEVRADLEPLAAPLAPTDPERSTLEALLSRAEQTGVGVTGTAILVARRCARGGE